jgi:hypothetical protein
MEVSGHFNPQERAPSTHLMGEWVGPKAGLDEVMNSLFYTKHCSLNKKHLCVMLAVLMF